MCFLFLLFQLSLLEVLGGAVELAEEGFPVAVVTAHHWDNWTTVLRSNGKDLGEDLLIDGHPPRCGQVFKNTSLAQTIKVNKKQRIKHVMNNTRPFNVLFKLLFFKTMKLLESQTVQPSSTQESPLLRDSNWERLQFLVQGVAMLDFHVNPVFDGDIYCTLIQPHTKMQMNVGLLFIFF